MKEMVWVLLMSVAGCGGSITDGPSYVEAGAADAGAPTPHQDAGPSGSHCDRCLQTYFSQCLNCSCQEVDAGTLVACGRCPDGDAGNVYNALYSCIGVQ